MMRKKKIHYHSDCQFFAGCENMLVNFFSSNELINKFDLTFSFRDTQEYKEGFYNRVKPNFKCFALDLPYLRNYRIIQKIENFLLGRLVIKLIRICTNIPFLIYDVYRLKKIFSKIKPDIIHINSGGYPPTMSAKSAVIAAQLSGIKKKILVVNNLAENYNSISRILDFPMDKYICKHVNYFITASKAAKNKLKKVLSLDEKKVLNIYNGIRLRDNSESFNETRNRLNLNYSKLTVFGMVALLIPRKGHKILINAINEIKKKKVKNFIVLIEGKGPLREELEEELKIRNLNKFCKFIGVENNVVNFISALDYLILPSIKDEDFPNVILEAMALGKIVIASNLSGISEQIIDEETGFLFKIGDYKKLAEIMINLMNRKYDTFKMKNNSKKRYITSFTNTISVRNYIKLYEHC